MSLALYLLGGLLFGTLMSQIAIHVARIRNEDRRILATNVLCVWVLASCAAFYTANLHFGNICRPCEELQE